MSKPELILAVDFDGTLCEHRYPDIGEEVPYAFDWLRKFQKAGVKLILWTMRADSMGALSCNCFPCNEAAKNETLTDAVIWCNERGVTFWGVNENPDQCDWTNSYKAYAPVYVDDAAIGCPLVLPVTFGTRPYANWKLIGPMVAARFDLKL